MSVDIQEREDGNSASMKATPIFLGLALLAFAGNAAAADAPKISAAKVRVFTDLFNEADVDGDGILSYEEFSKSHGASNRPAITQIRFEVLASFIKVLSVRGVAVPPPERGILLNEFIQANGGRKIKPTRSEIFWAADDDDSGGLNLDEFVDTRVVPVSNYNTVFNAFNGIDKNDDAIISPAEWGISVPE